MDPTNINPDENRKRMLQGELYFAFHPDLVADRHRSEVACHNYNNAGDVTRRRRVELWRDVIGDSSPMPPQGTTSEEDEQLLASYPWVHAPLHIDYGTNLRVGEGVFINFNLTVLDTCLVTIGARTLLGPNVSIYSGTHPEDPFLRNGTNGVSQLAKVQSLELQAWSRKMCLSSGS
ncbi:trimeric LpxA-like protein [Microthyrium microscopicum]|uniref:Trimeric LpxA-like protein n=1 Tax=Microthyrium microscopicum TaxID=703497 RepID=A0A6A6UVW4_9PEZI|nr:trimeric LpxA-like protein [Microthyrium microscopicum]